MLVRNAFIMKLKNKWPSSLQLLSAGVFTNIADSILTLQSFLKRSRKNRKKKP